MSQISALTSDEELLGKISCRDTAALSMFYERYASRLLGLLQKILQNRSDAEDVLQETFLQVWKDASIYDARRGLPRVWLFMVGRSRAVDRIRRRITIVSAETRSVDLKSSVGLRFSSDEPAALIDPCAPLFESERKAWVRSAMERLPIEQAQLITMAFYGGLSHSEISRKLGIPLGTVKTRIRTGIFALAADLGAADDGVADFLS